MGIKQGEVNKHKKSGILYAAVFLVTVLVYTVILLLQKAYPFGDKSFLTYDAYVQYKNMFHMLFEWISGGSKGSFIWSMGMGIDAVQESLYYCLSPFNILVLMMGESRLELSMVLLIIIKSACLPVTALCFFRHTNKKNTENGYSRIVVTFIELACSMAYGLSGYVLAYGHNIMWLDGLILLPIVALGIERLSDGKGWVLYTLSLTVSIICNFYFSFYICVFAVIYFLLEKRENVRDFLCRGLSFAGCSVLSALLAGVVLIPAGLVVMRAASSVTDMGLEGTQMWGQFGAYISSFYPLKDLECVSMFSNNSYCGSIVVFAACLFLLSYVSDWKTRVKYCIAMAVLVLALNYLPLNYVFHGMTITHGLGNRFAFILTFILLVVTYRILMNLAKLRLRYIAVSTAAAGVIFLASLIDNRDMSTPIGYVIFMLMLAFAVMLCVLCRRESIKPGVAVCIICGCWIVELIGNALYVMPGKTEDCLLADAVRLDQWESVYNSLNTEKGTRKSAMVNENYAPYSQTNWYSSMANGNTIRAFSSMGLAHFDNVEYIYSGTTPLTSLMYNVRYVLSPENGTYSGYSLIADNDVYNIYESDMPEMMGFVLDDDIEGWKADKSPFENQNDFIKRGCGLLSDVFTEIDISDWSTSYLNQDTLKESVGYCVYRTSNAFVPMTRYELDAASDMDMYVYSKDSRDHYVEMIVDGELRVSNGSYVTEQLSHVGLVKKGQHVRITIGGATSSKAGSVGERFVKVYNYNADEFEKAEEKILDSPLECTGFGKNTFYGNVHVKNPGILYIAYPFNDGFKIYVDGENVEKIRFGSGNMGVRISSGKHEIKITYRTPGLVTGVCVTIAGICIFMVLVGVQKRVYITPPPTP